MPVDPAIWREALHTLYCTLLVPCVEPGPAYDWIQYQQNVAFGLVPFVIIALYWALGVFDAPKPPKG